MPVTPPDWRTSLVFGVAGGMLGASLVVDYLEVRPWDWQAASAIAAFCVVLAALYPILRSEERRNAAAMALRVDLSADLLQLYIYLRTARDLGVLVGGMPFFSYEPASRALSSLRASTPRTEVLNPREQKQLIHAVRACEATRSRSPKPERAREIIEGLLSFVEPIGNLMMRELGEPTMALLYERKMNEDAPPPGTSGIAT